MRSSWLEQMPPPEALSGEGPQSMTSEFQDTLVALAKRINARLGTQGLAAPDLEAAPQTELQAARYIQESMGKLPGG